MNSFSLVTMRRHFTPRHKLSCSWFVWRRLIRKLRERGRNCSCESGAFLLGQRENGKARIADFVLYDDLDPRALDSGIVQFDGRYFSDLWAMCRARGLIVVADIHVHPSESDQSASDRDHPMIARAGHVALILPRFATGRQPRRDIGIYRYLGRKQWDTVKPSERREYFRINLF